MKYVKINEGNIPRILSARKLKTNLDGGGTCLWIPKDTVATNTKSVSVNGEYEARDDNLFAYSTVNVNIPPQEQSGISGIGSASMGGNGYTTQYVSKNELGELTIKDLPDLIYGKISSRKDEYNQPYSLIGDVVSPEEIYPWKHTGPDESDIHEWIDMDINPEWIIPGSEATAINGVIQEELIENIKASFYVHNPVILAYDPIIIEGRSSISDDSYKTEFTTYGAADFAAVIRASDADGYGRYDLVEVLYASKTQFEVKRKNINFFTGKTEEKTYTSESYTKNNLTVYYKRFKEGRYSSYEYTYNATVNNESNPIPDGSWVPKGAAWTYIYGFYEGYQTIGATWNRPGDGKELSFLQDRTVRLDFPSRN